MNKISPPQKHPVEYLTEPFVIFFGGIPKKTVQVFLEEMLEELLRKYMKQFRKESLYRLYCIVFFGRISEGIWKFVKEFLEDYLGKFLKKKDYFVVISKAISWISLKISGKIAEGTARAISKLILLRESFSKNVEHFLTQTVEEIVKEYMNLFYKGFIKRFLSLKKN